MSSKLLSSLVAAVAVSLGITIGIAGSGFVTDAAARGTIKIKKIKVNMTRDQVRNACEKSYPAGGYGYNAKKGGYGCANGNTGSYIDCKSNGKCVGGTGKE